MALSRSSSSPAPVGGLNSRDSIASMKPEDALVMENWFPETTDIRVRKGYSEHATGITGEVESLMPYSSISGSQKLFCAAGTVFHDATTLGAVGAAVVTGLSNARWQHVNYTNASSVSYLCCFNGVDKPQYYDGTNWIAIDGLSTPAITGVTTTGLINASVHKRRLWLTEINKLSVWYLPVDAVGGAATEYLLSGIAQKGGYVVATSSWTLDAGDGVDDYFVIVTSEGEVIVYRGTDPAAAATWALVGVWALGAPLGRRCLHKFGGDLLLITKQGVIPLSDYLLSAGTTDERTLTNKINQNMSQDAQLFGSSFGWQLLTYRNANMLILNVPVGAGVQRQYSMNTITGAFGVFKALPANCWAIHIDEPYFGGNGVVNRFWNVLSDNGGNIVADVKMAFNYFGTRGRVKQWKMMRPIFISDGTPVVRIGLNVDFQDKDLSSGVGFTPSDTALWGSGIWGTSLWGGQGVVSRNWATVHAIGISASPRIIVESSGIEVRLEAIDFIYEVGGMIG